MKIILKLALKLFVDKIKNCCCYYDPCLVFFMLVENICDYKNIVIFKFKIITASKFLFFFGFFLCIYK